MRISLAQALSDDGQFILDSLTLDNMKVNYPKFLRVYSFDYDRADQAMETLYGTGGWKAHREHIWQWYDQEYRL
tara:strand:+ start:136 stop:357 length:222 start_codon:yes stop_codon:yes gene_type:complete